MKYAEYKQSAVDILTPMLSINQRRDNNLNTMHNRTMEGVKNLVEGGAKAYTFYQRQHEVEYVGDDRLNEMKAELAQLEDELVRTENSMRNIKAEDLGSFDEERNEEGTKPYEARIDNPTPYDVDTIDINGGRTFPLGDVNPPYASKSSADVPVVEKKSTTVIDDNNPINFDGAEFNLEYGDINEEDLIEYGKHRYKPGARSLGGF